jgi:hypothetical protein
MRYIKNKLVTLSVTVIFSALIFQSCKDILDIDQENALVPEKYYRDVSDAYTAVRGIYGKFVNLAPQYVILNELRADLMDVGPDADYYLRQLCYHDTTNLLSNPYANPKDFFSLINDCNDVLKNLRIMLKDLKISQNSFDQVYSDISALRCWLYLQVAVQYGNVPYLTEPFEKVTDIDKINDHNLYPYLPLETIIDLLLTDMENLPSFEPYSDDAMLLTIDDFYPGKMYINKRFLLGDLYLWKGYYKKAAELYKSIMNNGSSVNYKVPEATDLINVNNYNSGYVRYYYYDVSSTLNHWPDMFMDINPSGSNYQVEWIWTVFYDDQYAPYNPFLKYFYNNISMIASQNIIEKWNSQVKRNDFKNDFRGKDGSYYLNSNNIPVINKFFGQGVSAKWGIYRAALLHLRFAEAANMDNKFKLAYAFINDGIRYTYDSAGATDLQRFERFQQTFLPPPYDFDARYITGTSNNQTFSARGEYRYNSGIRRRVYLKAIPVPDTLATASDSIQWLENKIIDEAALEMAFEGNRWSDLVRIAIRRNDPSFLADKIYDKLLKSGYPKAEEVHQRLMDRNNWFLPLK